MKGTFFFVHFKVCRVRISFLKLIFLRECIQISLFDLKMSLIKFGIMNCMSIMIAEFFFTNSEEGTNYSAHWPLITSILVSHR